MTVQTRPTVGALEAATVSRAQIDELVAFAECLDASELRDLLLSISRKALDGADLMLVEETSEYTPNQAAQQLGMSRTHLYKLLDRGAIASHRVGRDRRIRREDLIEFEMNRQRERRELAERFASPERSLAGAIEELDEDL